MCRWCTASTCTYVLHVDDDDNSSSVYRIISPWRSASASSDFPAPPVSNKEEVLKNDTYTKNCSWKYELKHCIVLSALYVSCCMNYTADSWFFFSFAVSKKWSCPPPKCEIVCMRRTPRAQIYSNPLRTYHSYRMLRCDRHIHTTHTYFESPPLFLLASATNRNLHTSSQQQQHHHHY